MHISVYNTPETKSFIDQILSSKFPLQDFQPLQYWLYGNHSMILINDFNKCRNTLDRYLNYSGLQQAHSF